MITKTAAGIVKKKTKGAALKCAWTLLIRTAFRLVAMIVFRTDNAIRKRATELKATTRMGL